MGPGRLQSGHLLQEGERSFGPSAQHELVDRGLQAGHLGQALRLGGREPRNRLGEFPESQTHNDLQALCLLC